MSETKSFGYDESFKILAKHFFGKFSQPPPAKQVVVDHPERVSPGGFHQGVFEKATHFFAQTEAFIDQF